MLIATVLAQAAVAAAPPAAVAPPQQAAPQQAQQQGVISYPVTFFAGQQVANAAEMLARVPGFSLDTGDSVRGFEGAAGNVIVDGQRPTSKTDNLEEILRRIPIAQIERIDIIRGGAPGIDMQGKTVIANVIKKSGASFRGLFAVANNHLWDGRNMHGMRVELSGGDGTRTWEALARYGYGNDDGGQFGDRVRFQPDGTILRQGRHQSEADGLQQILSGAYSQPLLGGRVSLNGRLFWDSWKNEDTTTYTTPVGRGPDNITSPYDEFQREFGLRFNRDFGPKTKLELVGLRTDDDYHAFDLFTGGNGDTSEFRNKRDTSESIVRGVLKHQASPKLSFEAGVEGALNKLDSKSSAFENRVPQVIPAANVMVEEKRGEVFGKAIWRPAAAWTIDGSLRFEASEISSDGDVVLEKKLQFLKPRLAVSWDVAPDTQLRARVERTVGQLDFDDFVAGSDFTAGTGVSAGNPDLNPQRAWVGEAAIEQRFWKSGAVTLTFRHSELQDVIDRGPVFLPTGQVFDQPTNIGDGTKDELILQYSVPLSRLGLSGATLRGDVTKRWSSVTDPTTHRKREISDLRPVEWNATYTQDLPAWKISYGIDAFGGRRETAYSFNRVRTTKLNTFVRPFAEYRPRPDINIRLELPNVTARNLHRTVVSYSGPRNAPGSVAAMEDREYQPGRMVYIRIRKTLGG